MSLTIGVSETTVALIAGFGGALVGGVLALVGNLIAARRELTREHRVQLYMELVPRLLEHLRALDVKSASQDATAIERAATVAGRRDRRKSAAVVADARGALDRHRGRFTDDERAAFEQANGRAIASAERYDRWLAERF